MRLSRARWKKSRPAYHPALLLKVWLYAYALGVTSARRLEQRVREDLAFRYLAAGAGPDFWTLNQFRTRQALLRNSRSRRTGRRSSSASAHALRSWHSKLRHPVQHSALDRGFDFLVLDRAGREACPEYRLVP